MTVFRGTFSALNANANPVVMMVGDSWFWYPFDDLANEIGAALPNHDVLVVGRGGAEAAEWSTKLAKDIDFAFKMYATGVQALLLSGGGNDLAGADDLPKILADDCSKATTPAGCYRPGQPESFIAGVSAAYEALIVKFRAVNANANNKTKAPVLLHNYDHAWPTGNGVFGPAQWLKEPMDRAKVPQALRREVLKDVLARLRKAQLALGKKADLAPVVALPTAGTMPADDPLQVDAWWANELHPTPAGFRLLARKRFVPALKKVGLG